ncbi:hypothetical protein, partial [Flavobacterium sp. GT3R68]|uniref:hypothetical protein n=1 Tax=Flavobacterium sp. GT3R68 TaxID=2594437 RepID=UPI001C8F6FD2
MDKKALAITAVCHNGLIPRFFRKYADNSKFGLYLWLFGDSHATEASHRTLSGTVLQKFRLNKILVF